MIDWKELNVAGRCRRYGVGLWSCPGFIFLIIGLIIIVSMIGAYLIANRFFEEPEISALIVLITALILIIMNYIITNSFERLALANRLQSDFINIFIGHKMRTPLSILKWTTELLIKPDGVPPMEKKEYLEILNENVNRLLKLINNLLEVTRIENGKIKLDMRPVSLNKIIGEVIEELKFLAENNGIRLNFENKTDLPLILADPQKAKIIISNLLDNAIRYNLPGKNVKIYVEKLTKYLKVNIEDEGVGILKEDRNQVFRKFFRSQNILKNQIAGSGLGLYLVKALIEAQNGKIDFESKENEGSKFWFTLPLA